MKVFLAGGTGVVGKALIPQLRAAGHQVVATTRRPERVETLTSLGADPVVLDAVNREDVVRAVTGAHPEAIIHQLTALPPVYAPSRPNFYEATNRLRSEATTYLLEGAQAAGVKIFVFQSICFLYKLKGPRVLSEDAPVAHDAPEPFGEAVRNTIAGEQRVVNAPGMRGVVLRYGQLYGPGTYFAPDGDFARRARRRMLPIVAGGRGVFSFLHVDDSAGAAVSALDRGAGVYNIVDDDPAPAREWIPVFCAAVGAPKPFNVPLWVARLATGSYLAETMAHFRGATNTKAKAELDWSPRVATWRRGFYL